MPRILIVDDEKSIRVTFREFLTDQGYDVQEAKDALEALAILEQSSFDVVITDIIMPKMSGVKLLEAVHRVSPQTQVIMITGEPTFETALEILRLGASDYIVKPVSETALVRVVGNAVKTKNLLDDKLRLQAENKNYQENLEHLVEERTGALHAERDKLKSILEAMEDGVYITSKDYEIEYLHPILIREFGEIEGRKCYEYFHKRDTPCPWCKNDEVFAGKTVRWEWSSFLNRKSYDLTDTPIRNSDGTISKLEIFHDITARKLTEDKIRESESKFRAIIEESADPIYILHGDRFDLINSKFSEVFGITKADIAVTDFNFLKFVAPESKALILSRHAARQRGETLPSSYEFMAFDKSNNLVNIEASVSEISYRGGVAILGFLRDVTSRKTLEAQFHQAQKMESVGRLAGGIAHDFNNLLTIITGYSEMMMVSMNSRDPLFDSMKEIKDAASRASDLTRQLLIFSRSQRLQLQVVNLNSIVQNLDKMLRRIIGEDTSIRVVPDEDIWNIKADPGQLEQVIINLVVNARDAMQKGGSVSILTQNVSITELQTELFEGLPLGEYVMLSITDTGEGMSEETQLKIFEPFFTTKESGKGTGLGLSTVFGIVKQSKGFVFVQSQLGKGTTFKILLPKEIDELDTTVNSLESFDLTSGSELVLIVEDDADVRELICTVLKSRGYKVLEAENGAEALVICKTLEEPLALVIADVIMPNMNGPELVAELLQFLPDLKVLFMSGHKADTQDHAQILESGDPFLQKPFRPIDLTLKVRNVLDGKQ
jgi:two-component system, cell cycle sensor histidine kinase and response regulator CckA